MSKHQRTLQSSGRGNPCRDRRATRLAVSLSLVAGSVLGVTQLVGCGAQSFLDPSVSGKWTQTPMISPVLDRIATIEDSETEAIEYTAPIPEDMLPHALVYKITPGDGLEVTLYDLIITDKPDTYQVVVDTKGFVELPQLGRVQVGGKTVEQAIAEVQEKMKRLVTNPLAQINVANQRGATYSIVGNVERAGTYTIPNSNYHLLEAITAGGRFEETVEFIYVIRSVPLSDAATDAAMNPGAAANPAAAAPVPNPQPDQPKKTGDDLLKIIDDITGPNAKKPSSPGVVGSGVPSATYVAHQPQPAPTPPAAPAKPAAEPKPAPASVTPPGAVADPNAPAPAVDLDDSTPASAKANAAGSDQPKGAAPGGLQPSSTTAAGRWVFVNGKWVQATAVAPAQAGKGGRTDQRQQLMTQRVLRIATKDLLAGVQSVNVIIRPGDVLRVPAPPTGLVYMAGQVSRPGPINLPSTGGLTLLRALDAAGGLSSIAIPERIDLTRMLGHDRQATILLNGRAIAEHTQPDVYLKANDRVNVGTNFWALPLAVVRNGFRMNYGFGFLIDRNFGNDIFGPPPETNLRGQP